MKHPLRCSPQSLSVCEMIFLSRPMSLFLCCDGCRLVAAVHTYYNVVVTITKPPIGYSSTRTV